MNWPKRWFFDFYVFFFGDTIWYDGKDNFNVGDVWYEFKSQRVKFIKAGKQKLLIKRY